MDPRAFPADERNEARSFDLIMRLRVDIAAKGGKFFANGMSGLAEFFLEGVDGFAGGVGVLCGCSRSLERGLLRSGIHAGGRVPSRSEKRSIGGTRQVILCNFLPNTEWATNSLAIYQRGAN